MRTHEELIQVAKPSIGEKELAEVRKVFDSKWLGLGLWVKQFEDRLKAYLGAEYVIAVNTGTTALHLSLDAIGIKIGDEVIVPSLTFAASAQAIAATGAKPVFCDIEAATLNMDPDDLRKKITGRTKAIMPVHYSGLPCDMGRIREMCGAKKIRIVEDAAHAFGSVYKGKKIGSTGDVVCFSFDPIKTITCGEGGAIVTSDKKLAERIYKKRILGIDKDTWSRYKHKRDWFYEVTELGYRYHMSNINAAIGLVQMEKVDAFIARKKDIVKKYDDGFKELKEITLIKRDYRNTAPFNYIIRIKNGRDRLMSRLKKHNIDSGVHYIPNHLQPFFKKSKTALPVTEKVWLEMITLPLYYDMTDRDVSRVIGAVSEFFV